MTRIQAGSLSGKGMVPTLVIVGIVLVASGISEGIGQLAIVSGIAMGIFLGGLGVIGVAKKVM